ncbi:hypothetical protein ACIBTZ_13215 [Micromonospora sp. NPDC049460]|uniref:hypothetical protein n=1 Tax=Micromonospora sp. NPDC049460 TaxID=3364272 RepID=UPI0037BA0649
MHSTSLISGLLFIALGALFLAFDGTAGLSDGVGLTDVEGAAQEWVTATLGSVPDEAVLLLVAAAAPTVLLRR